MGFTFGEFRKIVAPYAGRSGRCATSEEVAVFSRQVMENLLYSGSQAGVRKVCILAYMGMFTLPPEVEVPIKAKIDHQVANVWSKWLSYHSVDNHFEKCGPAGEIFAEDGSYSPLAYQLPPDGSVIGVMGNCEEAGDSFVIVQGRDLTGKEIYTTFDGEQVVGEKFRIKKGELRFGKVRFGEITALTKPQTNGYVSLFAVDEISQQIRQFLGSYSPSEERPLYRVFKLITRKFPYIVHLSMLCRVRLKDSYHDNEITLFDNSLAILLSAQRLQSEVNNDVQTAGYKSQAVDNILEREAGYRKAPVGPLDICHVTAGSSIRNIIR